MNLFFSGYASRFQSPDINGDIVQHGAFTTNRVKTLQPRQVARVRMLAQHDAGEPVGRWLELKETTQGLHCTGEIFTGVRRGRDLAALLMRGGLDGLSIGFRTIKARKLPRGRLIERLDLWEISLVTFPMHPQARVDRVWQEPMRQDVKRPRRCSA